MAKIGKDISDGEIQEIMKRHDISGDKSISLEEFKKMILDEWLFQFLTQLFWEI